MLPLDSLHACMRVRMWVAKSKGRCSLEDLASPHTKDTVVGVAPSPLVSCHKLKTMAVGIDRRAHTSNSSGCCHEISHAHHASCIKSSTYNHRSHLLCMPCSTCCGAHAGAVQEIQAPSERINGGARAWQQHFKIYLEIFIYVIPDCKYPPIKGGQK